MSIAIALKKNNTLLKTCRSVHFKAIILTCDKRNRKYDEQKCTFSEINHRCSTKIDRSFFRKCAKKSILLNFYCLSLNIIINS